MDSNSVKQIKKLFSEMFNYHYKKMCEMYNGLEKSISEMIEANNKITNQKLEKPSAEIRSNSDSAKLLSQKTKDLEGNLTVNQDLIDVMIKSIDEEMKEIKKIVDNNRAEPKEQLRIQEDCSRRNNVRFDRIPETENETWEETETKLRKFLYDELDITEELYIERAHRVARNQSSKEASNDLAKPRTIIAKLLDYKEKEEIMKRAFKLKDTGFYIREDYSKETISIRKKLWEDVKNLCKKGKYAVLKYEKIVTHDFRPKR